MAAVSPLTLPFAILGSACIEAHVQGHESLSTDQAWRLQTSDTGES